MGLVVIIAGIISYLSYQTTLSFNRNDKPIIVANVDQFIAYISQGKISDAAALADPKYIPVSILGDSFLQIQDLFNGYEKQDNNFSYLNIRQFSDGKEVTYETKAYFSDGLERVISVVAIQQNNVWKLAGVRIMAPSSQVGGRIIQRGDEVDPTLQNTIINAYESQKSIYLSGDITAIRKHMILADAPQAAQIANMSDADLVKMNTYQIQAITRRATSTIPFRSHDAVWSFNKDKTTVLIKLPTTVTSENGQVGNDDEQGSYSNGQWYF